MTPGSPQQGPGTHLMPFIFDLTAHEIRRMTAVLDAMPDWDPAAVLAAEVEAHSMLYSGLNTEQRSVYDLLCEEGVLDAGP
ncbi:MAG: hypothetical protein DLM60_16895 [Pseudonocardiales bacterium]|nr:DUF6400 family protein [Actinomycetota bacterium]PZS15572.1 MAG: hypothetical protein DLM60_16895 [Pseudonocardiales bacterium]